MSYCAILMHLSGHQDHKHNHQQGRLGRGVGILVGILVGIVTGKWKEFLGGEQSIWTAPLTSRGNMILLSQKLMTKC